MVESTNSAGTCSADVVVNMKHDFLNAEQRMGLGVDNSALDPGGVGRGGCESADFEVLEVVDGALGELEELVGEVRDEFEGRVLDVVGDVVWACAEGFADGVGDGGEVSGVAAAHVDGDVELVGAGVAGEIEGDASVG